MKVFLLAILLFFTGIHSQNSNAQIPSEFSPPFMETEGGGIIIIGDGILPPPPPNFIIQGKIIIEEANGDSPQFYVSCMKLFSYSNGDSAIQDYSAATKIELESAGRTWVPRDYERRLVDICNSFSISGKVRLKFGHSAEYELLRNWLFSHKGEIIWLFGELLDLDYYGISANMDDTSLRRLILDQAVRLEPSSLYIQSSFGGT